MPAMPAFAVGIALDHYGLGVIEQNVLRHAAEMGSAPLVRIRTTAPSHHLNRTKLARLYPRVAKGGQSIAAAANVVK